VASNAVLAPIFLAIADVTPGFLRALMTAATCSSASTGNTARISLSPVWCWRTPGIDQTFEKRRGRSV
jgi:hypothetical protein